MNYSIRNLRYSYDGRELHLDIPELDIASAAVNVLYGDNGSGKTTLLKYLAGLLPSEGAGTVETDLERIRREAVYLHQQPYLLRGSVESNLRLARADGGRGDEAAVAAALEIVGLARKRHANVRTLSGGERKRAAVARALLTEREVLLFDEPAAHLDATTRRGLEELFPRLTAEGRTVIVTTHLPEFGYRIGEARFTLDGGRLTGPTNNVYRGLYRREEQGGARFLCGDASFAVPDLDGEFRTAVIEYDDIILTDEHPASSARNLIDGRVLAIRENDRGRLIDVDAGIPITARITEISLNEMNLVPGSRVAVLFKASSVRLY